MGHGAGILPTYGQGNRFREAIGLDQDGQLASGRVWTWVQVCRSQIQGSFHPSASPHTHRSLGYEAAWRLPMARGQRWMQTGAGSVQTHCGPVSGGRHLRAQTASWRDPGRHRSSPSFSTLSALCGCTTLLFPQITSLASCWPSPRNGEHARGLGDGGIQGAMPGGIPEGQ